MMTDDQVELARQVAFREIFRMLTEYPDTRGALDLYYANLTPESQQLLAEFDRIAAEAEAEVRNYLPSARFSRADLH